MAKRKIPGLSKSKGMQPMGITLFPAGKFVFQVVKHTEKESAKGTGVNHNFQFKCLEALDPSQSDMEGKRYFHRMFEMLEDHGSFEKYSYIFTDELKSIADAVGIQVKGDAFAFDDLQDTEFIATLVQVDGEDAEGNPRKENKITKYESVS